MLSGPSGPQGVRSRARLPTSCAQRSKIIENADGPSALKPTLQNLVDHDWRERLCTLQVLANHGDLEASNTLQAWCANDPEAREIHVSLTTSYRSALSTDGC